MEVTTSSSTKYKNYNDSLSKPEAGGSYNSLNHTYTEIIDGKKVVTEKPVAQWAIGRYQHYYVHQEHKIIPALQAQGINTDGLSKEDIARAYQNSPKAQEEVQGKINDENFTAAKKQIEKHGLTKAPIEEIAFLNHFLGNTGAERYLSYLDKYGYDQAGYDRADMAMAYGDDDLTDKFNGIGGPKSKAANAFVSVHMDRYRKSAAEINAKQPTSNTNSPAANPVTPKETKITAKNLNLPFDEVVNSYTELTEGKLSGINELQYNPMGWGAKHGIKRKGQSWPDHGDHVHISFTDPQVALAIIKKAQEIGLNAAENLYTGEVHDVHAHDKKTGAKTSHHYFNFEGEFDGKKLSKAVDINATNTKLTVKEADAKMKQLYKWIHQTYSI